MYGIGAVARMVGVSPTALRAWEERYRVVVPARSRGDQRLYSRDQLDQLVFVQELIQSGLHAAEAHRLLAQRLEEGATLVSSVPSGTSASVSILLAERDVYAAELVEYLLRTEGYDVAVPMNPEDAVASFRHRGAELVFVELVVSGGSGVELCRRLHAAGARVVAVSALDLGAVAIESGAEAFLRKPLDPLQLLATVKDLVGVSRLVRRTTQAMES